MAQMLPSLSESIAIVGSGYRFPGGTNSRSSLWKLLETTPDLCREISADRFNTASFYHPNGDRHGTTNARHAYLMDEDVRMFDAAFFNISANEAESIDPQQRILLETVYEALETGGHTVESLRGSDTSVYVGTMTVDYHDTLLRDHNTTPKYFATGINRAILSNRISYFFDWHGPSMTIDTACSSSLIAVHQGVQSLRSGESRVSVACGTQVLLGYDMYIGESKLKMLSPTGRSRMWDVDADGYARGEGVAAVVMKRLSDALADGDHVECVIRETGVNQDGFSNGLTVPSSQAQAALIRSTYARAGLDPEHRATDRPQYFEAHGTGTQVGDPKEAAAIYEALGRYFNTDEAHPLHVGSIKTVIGHLEGAAGLAGLLKASISLQKAVITRNLSFCRLNPKIEPFYQGLQVPTKNIPWPILADGVPRRASVNSFGFGGTNAHVILEAHTQSGFSTLTEPRNLSGNLVPYVFSAATETSLDSLLQRYSAFLKVSAESELIDTSDLAWTLHSRRSEFPVKAAFPASSIAQLVVNIDHRLAVATHGTDSIPNINTNSTVGVRSTSKGVTPHVLGIFTGQGAQWPAMGAHLIRNSNFVSKRLQHLEDSLAALPASDRPTWSLRVEMLAEAGTSHVAEAAFSQPLCTALQILLVDLLRAANITFAAVVGHSSGEIAAAYAAGFISAHDAIRIAYYRGLCANRARNTVTGQYGAMLAAGLSFDEAQKLVNQPLFKDRLAIAAHNSSASVTLSGDADAVAEARAILDKQNKFARVLKIDTAYHSHHMLPCCEEYLASLRTCNVKVNYQRDTTCRWFSSVLPNGQIVEATDQLKDLYWLANMANTVLFADAVKNAIENDDYFNLALEVGPHPALKSPASQNIGDVRPTALPYFGILSRGIDGVEAFSNTLGSLWTIFGSASVDLATFEKVVSSPSRPHKLVLDLPSYQWDHSRTYWSESRRSRRMRTRKSPPHELLGVLSPESGAHEMRWLNILKTSEIIWLEGHQLQGMVVFPAAGYTAMAVEACRQTAGAQSVQLFEIYNLSIVRAITFEESNPGGIETLVTLSRIAYNTDQTITADFSVCAGTCVREGSEHDLELTASAKIKIVLSSPDTAALPGMITTKEDFNMSEVDSDHVYRAFSRLGYGYTGAFQGLSATKRRLNRSSAMVNAYNYSDDELTSYLVHPVMLDVAIQTAMLAYGAPDDGALWSLHVPTYIQSVRINPSVCNTLPFGGAKVPVSAVLNDSHDFSANIDVFSEDGRHGMVQIEDMILKPVAPATKADDRSMFLFTALGVAEPNALRLADVNSKPPFSDEAEVASICERIAYYYLYLWNADLSDQDQKNAPQLRFTLLQGTIEGALSRTPDGHHLVLQKERSNPTIGRITLLKAQYLAMDIAELIRLVGQNLLAAMRKDTTLVELPATTSYAVSSQNGSHAKYQHHVSSLVSQITYRYPHAKILEISNGDDPNMHAVLERIACYGGAMPTYTFTNASSEIVRKVACTFNTTGCNVLFSTLDIKESPSAQGFASNAYDIIITSNVLHATASLQQKLTHIRQLLRPGGRLVTLELTESETVRFETVLRSPSVWPPCAKEGREFGPITTPDAWHRSLCEAGFGGIDTITPGSYGTSPFCVMATQAVDDQIAFLRQPLLTPSTHVVIDRLVLLGNGGTESADIAKEISKLLVRFCNHITFLHSLPTDDNEEMGTFINLADLDAPVFKDISSNRLEGLKRVFRQAKHVLWLTRGAYAGENPYHAASLAFCRTLANEVTHASINTLDISSPDKNVSEVVAEQLLRQCALEKWDKQHLTWSEEPETILHNGELLLPRILPNLAQNARLNTSRREVTKKVAASDPDLSILSESASPLPRLVTGCTLRTLSRESQKIQVNVCFTTMAALPVAPGAFLHLSVGNAATEGRCVIAASTTNSYTVTPLAVVDVPDANGAIDADHVLIATVSEVLGASLMRCLAPGSSVLVQCSRAHRYLTSALMHHATANAIRVTFVCITDIAQESDPSWIQLNPRATRHTVRRNLLAVKPTHFLDLTAGWSPQKATGLDITNILPPECRRLELSDVRRHEASLPQPFNKVELLENFQKFVARARSAVAAMSTTEKTDAQGLVLQLDQIHINSAAGHATSIVHWPACGQIEAEVRPMDYRSLFSQDKTYLLFGLGGDIGQSLCEWMVSNGAGCVVLTSRRPKADPGWLESLQHTGSVIKIEAVDVTDRGSLTDFLQTIRTTCPPVGGVVNGANILRDAPFERVSAEMVREALDPKILGSYNLDQAFYSDNLDFFVLLSSISCVIGTAGQSIYAAANGYLNGLARQRRSRGLNASAFDMGLVLGIGNAEVANKSVALSMQRYGIVPLSERDLRIAFAESIVAGFVQPPDKECNPFPAAVMTSGLRTITTEERDIRWYSNPIFSHLVTDAEGTSEAEVLLKNDTMSVPLKDRLAALDSEAAAVDILKDCCSSKLNVLLGGVDGGISNDSPLVELGTDSLVAVELRSWFLKMLDVDVPVLKILGGTSLAQICEHAVEMLWQRSNGPSKRVDASAATDDRITMAGTEQA